MPRTLPGRFFGVNHQLSRLRLFLTAALILCGFVTADSQEQMSREVRISVFNMECMHRKEQASVQNYTGWQVKFGEQTVTMDHSGKAMVKLTYPKESSASSNVSVIVPNEPKAKLFMIYYNDWSKDRDGTGDYALPDYNYHANDLRDYDRDGVLSAMPYRWWDENSATQPVRQPYMVLGVEDLECKANLKEYKAVVRLKTLECDKTDFANYSVKIEGNEVKFNMAEGAYDVPIKEGRNRISISVPDFPDAKIKEATVVSHGGERSFEKSADELGQIELMLEPDLFTGKPVIPGNQIMLHLYTGGDCPTSYEPPLQRLGAPPRIKVASVKGKVTVSKDNSEDESLVTVSSMIEDQQIIYTRPGARTELVASDKRLFILEEATVAKFIISKNSTGVWEINCEQRSGAIGVRHVGYDRKAPKGYEWKILTPTAAITEKGTVYTVTYDEKSNVTTVGVEQGQVEIMPTNTSLNPFTLAAHKMLDIFEDRVSSISPYSGAADPKGSLTKESGGQLNRPLLLVGLGAAALVGLLVVVAGITFLYRRVNRAPVKPAFQQSGMKVEATPANLATPPRLGSLASPAVVTNEWRCPNPQCGKLMPAGKKFCTACGGTQSGVKAVTRAVNIASPAVATSEWRCPNPQCGKLVPAAKKFCTACGTPVIGHPPNPGPIVT